MTVTHVCLCPKCRSVRVSFAEWRTDDSHLAKCRDCGFVWDTRTECIESLRESWRKCMDANVAQSEDPSPCSNVYEVAAVLDAILPADTHCQARAGRRDCSRRR